MLAVDRTTDLFVRSIQEALPGREIAVTKSRTAHGNSNYVYIRHRPGMPIKVRISDHPVGMRRARYGYEALFIAAGTPPDRWAVWLGALVRQLSRSPLPLLSFDDNGGDDDEGGQST